jgi:hypothetical protein
MRFAALVLVAVLGASVQAATFAPTENTDFDIRSDIGPLLTIPPNLYITFKNRRAYYDLSFPWSIRFGGELRPHRLLIEPGFPTSRGEPSWLRLGYRTYLHAGASRAALGIGHGIRITYPAGQLSYSPELLLHTRNERVPGSLVVGARADFTGRSTPVYGLLIGYSYW